MNSSEVLQRIIESEKLNRNSFSKKIGVNYKEVCDIISGDTKSITPKFANKILKAFPNYNRIWLLTGEGEIFAIPKKNDDYILVSPSDISYTENSDVIDPLKFAGSLVYNIDGTCGPSNRNFDFVDECIIGSINLPGFDRNMPIVQAVEDSMIPRINPNDYVGLQEVLNWDVIFWGKPYFIITQDYRMFKVLNRCREDDRCVILHSINEDFEDIIMKKSEILKLFIVKKVLSLRTEMM